MRTVKIFLFCFCLAQPLLTLAYTPKEGNVSAAAGPFFHRTNFHGSDDRPVSPVMSGIGLLVTGDISDHGSLEVGLSYLNKVFYRDQGEDFLAEQTQLMDVSFGYRRYFSSYFSVGAGFSTAYPMGSRKVVHSVLKTGYDMDTSASDNVIYSFLLSAQQEMWSQDRLSILLEAHYSMALTNKPNELADHYGLQLLFRYFIQEKQVQERPRVNDTIENP